MKVLKTLVMPFDTPCHFCGEMTGRHYQYIDEFTPKGGYQVAAMCDNCLKGVEYA